jgi:hypothetical protein
MESAAANVGPVDSVPGWVFREAVTAFQAAMAINLTAEVWPGLHRCLNRRHARPSRNCNGREGVAPDDPCTPEGKDRKRAGQVLMRTLPIPSRLRGRKCCRRGFPD